MQHEQVHVGQWVEGSGHIFGDLFLVSTFFNQISGLTGGTSTDLANQVEAAKSSFKSAQLAIHNQRLAQAEQEAYAVSDPIAPQYFYQSPCGRQQ